jgi:hypothetical protein
MQPSTVTRSGGTKDDHQKFPPNGGKPAETIGRSKYAFHKKASSDPTNTSPYKVH